MLGEEDKISLRLDPQELGVLSFRSSKIWNMSKPAEVLKLNTTGRTWSGGPLHSEMIKQIQEVVLNNPKSKRREDQLKQKKLYWDLVSLMPSFRNTEPKHWKELMKNMAGRKPMNPIFRNFLKICEDVDFEDEEMETLGVFS